MMYVRCENSISEADPGLAKIVNDLLEQQRKEENESKEERDES